MENLSQVVGAEVFWVQPAAFQRSYELRSENALFGRLVFQSALGTLATAETSAGSWTFKRSGFLNPLVTIRKSGEQNETALFHPQFQGTGWLSVNNNRAFLWKSTNFWGSEWGFFDAKGGTLCLLRPGTPKPQIVNLIKSQSTLEIKPDARSIAELPLLVMLGWYLMILHQADTTSAIVTTTSAIY